MHPNAQLIEKFYRAFAQRDAKSMVACYHPEVRFSDPVFTDLRGTMAGDMWTMLCERGTDLKIEHGQVKADDKSGSAHWEAWYTFATTKRKVHNIIDAEFEFRDGLILRHTDRFSFRRWAGQALGPMGVLLGGTGFLQNKVRAMAGKSLDEFLAKKSRAA